MFGIFLILIFIRPFISALAFPYLNFIYSAFLTVFLVKLSMIKRISLGKKQALRYPVICFFLALMISVVCSTNRLNSFQELYPYIDGILILLVVASLAYEDKMRIIRTIAWAGLIISMIAIYQYILGFKHILNYMAKVKVTDLFALEYIQRKRAFFPFITPNTLGGYLAMIIPLTLIFKKNVWFIIPIASALLLTQSLGAFLSFFVGLCIYFYLQGKLEKKGIIFLSGVLLIIGLVFVARTVTQKAHLQPIFSTIMRLTYWQDTLNIIKAHPLKGVGLGNFDLMHSRFAHNSYLQIWSEMGIWGLMSLLWLIYKSLKIGLKKFKVSKKRTYFIVGLVSANSVFLSHNLIDFTFFLPEVSLIWWILLGLII